MTVRRLITIFRFEVVRIREVQAAACFKLTRLWRGWIARRRIVLSQIEFSSHAKQLRDYKNDRQVVRNHARQIAMNRRLARLYVEERGEEQAARFCGLVHPSAARGNKMIAFQTSSYGSNKVALGSCQLITQITDGVCYRVSRNSSKSNRKVRAFRLLQNRDKTRTYKYPAQIYRSAANVHALERA